MNPIKALRLACVETKAIKELVGRLLDMAWTPNSELPGRPCQVLPDEGATRPKSPERPTTTPNSVKQRPERRGTGSQQTPNSVQNAAPRPRNKHQTAARTARHAHDDSAKKDCHMQLVEKAR